LQEQVSPGCAKKQSAAKSTMKVAGAYKRQLLMEDSRC
jgi:hypothetical protein